jgi:hypothetical protein
MITNLVLLSRVSRSCTNLHDSYRYTIQPLLHRDADEPEGKRITGGRSYFLHDTRALWHTLRGVRWYLQKCVKGSHLHRVTSPSCTR